MNHADDLNCLAESIGNSVERTETLTAEPVRRFVAALGTNQSVEKTRLGHWAYFLPDNDRTALAADGAVEIGKLALTTFQRRMFASSTINFLSELQLGRPATKKSLVTAIDRRSGSTGNLILIRIEDTIVQGADICIREERTLALISNAAPIPAVEVSGVSMMGDDQVWMPSSVDLFRFSAATFNSHRIHYDLPYATNTEGYPGLVVQGPLTAAHLFAYAERRSKRIGAFMFRATAPLFAMQPVVLRQISTEEFHAIRCDGVVAMMARVRFGSN